MVGRPSLGGSDASSFLDTSSASQTKQGDLTLEGTLSVGGAVQGERLELTEQLGSSATPQANVLYRDNLIKAWAFTDRDGTQVDGFNLTSTTGGSGGYRYTFRTAMASSTYAVVATRSFPTTDIGPLIPIVISRSTTEFLIMFSDGDIYDGDLTAHSVIVIGN